MVHLGKLLKLFHTELDFGLEKYRSNYFRKPTELIDRYNQNILDTSIFELI